MRYNRTMIEQNETTPTHTLSQQDLDILQLKAMGLTLREMGMRLGFNTKALHCMYEKILAENNFVTDLHAILFAITTGALSTDDVVNENAINYIPQLTSTKHRIMEAFTSNLGRETSPDQLSSNTGLSHFTVKNYFIQITAELGVPKRIAAGVQYYIWQTRQ